MEGAVQRAQALRIAAHTLLTASMTTGKGADSSANSGSESMESAVRHLLDESESVIKLLDQGQVPSHEMSANFIVSSMDVISALAHMTTSLELKVEELGSVITCLKDQFVEMQQQLDELRESSDSLLFRELGTQTVSKIVRKRQLGALCGRLASFRSTS